MPVKNVINQIKKLGIRWIRLQFCNPFGLLHQLNIPAEEITKQSFVSGFPLDGSSIMGFTTIDKSDILLVPDPSTFAILPEYFDTTSQDTQNYSSKSARMFVDVYKGFGAGRFSRDPRFIAQKAEQYAKNNGYDKTYWAAELEFFIFDKIQSSSPQIFSKEAPWISQNTEDVIHLKRGYYRDSPSDTLTNFRDEVCDTMKHFGINTIAHHHEVATAGQSEIVLGYQG